MDIVIVAAFGRGNERIQGESMPIGKNGKIPWLGKLPVDMKRFRKLTLGKPIVMGRKTFASLDNKPLPDRINIVLSRDPAFQPEGVVIARTVDEVLALIKDAPELMVIGGEQIYREFLPHATRLELTAVLTDFNDADTFFPEEYFTGINWHIEPVIDNEPDDQNAYWCRFITKTRV